MWSGSEEGSCLRLIDFCFTLLWARENERTRRRPPHPRVHPPSILVRVLKTVQSFITRQLLYLLCLALLSKFGTNKTVKVRFWPWLELFFWQKLLTGQFIPFLLGTGEREASLCAQPQTLNPKPTSQTFNSTPHTHAGTPSHTLARPLSNSHCRSLFLSHSLTNPKP